MTFLRGIGLLTIVSLALTLPGCKRESGKTRVAFISNNAFTFWKIAEKGTEKAAAEFGVEVDFKMPQQASAEEQQRIIRNLLNRGVKAIAISPNDAANLQNFLEKEVAPKVALLTVDSDVPNSDVRRCYVGTHNYRAGRAAGELVLKAVPKGGKVVIFVGALDVQNAVERRQGVLDVLSGRQTKSNEMEDRTDLGATDLKVGKYVLVKTQTDNRDPKTCQSRAKELLIQHPDLACLVGLWEYNPPALLRAVATAEAKPPIVGFDENEQTLNGIIDGQVVGTVVQNPYQFGYEAVRIMAALAKGDESVLKDRKDIDAQNRIFVPHEVLSSKEEVEKFRAKLKELTAR
jgi:ribose transport system substrate-binding protein